MKDFQRALAIESVNYRVDTTERIDVRFVYFESQIAAFMDMKSKKGVFNVREAIDRLFALGYLDGDDYEDLMRCMSDYDLIKEIGFTEEAFASIYQLFLFPSEDFNSGESDMWDRSFCKVCTAACTHHKDHYNEEIWYLCYGLVLWMDMCDERKENDEPLTLTF